VPLPPDAPPSRSSPGDHLLPTVATAGSGKEPRTRTFRVWCYIDQATPRADHTDTPRPSSAFPELVVRRPQPKPQSLRIGERSRRLVSSSATAGTCRSGPTWMIPSPAILRGEWVAVSGASGGLWLRRVASRQNRSFSEARSQMYQRSQGNYQEHAHPPTDLGCARGSSSSVSHSLAHRLLRIKTLREDRDHS